MRRFWIAPVSLLAAALIFSGSSHAQDSFWNGCKPHLKPMDQLSFTHDTHRKWYVTFWDGQCKGLVFCTREFYWNDVMQSLLQQNGDPRKQALIVRMCKLGHRVGLEWAKDNNVRCIHTDPDFENFGKILEEQGSAFDKLDKIEAIIDARPGCAR